MKHKSLVITRRHFVKQASMAGGLLFIGPTSISPILSTGPFRDMPFPKLKINIFSKHLQFLDYTQMAERAQKIGFDGIDLTVRSGGHVLPENVERDLPLAIKAIRQVGLEHQMITTTVGDANNELDKKILETAAAVGVKLYRMNWFHYPDNSNMPVVLEALQQKMKNLSLLNKDLGLVGCYQNHAGQFVGTSLWEIYEILKLAGPEYIGVQYDIRHATVEGGLSWVNGLRLIHPQIKTLVFKDFKWEKIKGNWEIVNTPIGEGIVDFKTYFRLLKKYKINRPVSLHLEYPLGGAEHGKRELACDPKLVYEAMAKDLKTIKKFWEEA